MIYIKCPVKHDLIIDLLEGYDSGDIRFRFISKTGMVLAFDVNTKNLEVAAEAVHKILDSNDFFLVIKYQVSY